MKNKSYYKFLMLIFIVVFVVLCLLSTYFITINFVPKNINYLNNGNYIQKWITNELFDRQILVKKTIHYIDNNETLKQDEYYNAIILDNNKIYAPLELVASGKILDDNNINIIPYENVRYYYTFCKEQTLLNSIVWNELELNINFVSSILEQNDDIINNNFNFSQCIFNTINNFEMSKTNFKLESIVRDDVNYPYLYSSITISEDFISHEITIKNFITLKNSSLTNDYFTYQAFNINEKNVILKTKFNEIVSFNSNINMRNVGATGSFAIDLNGYIFGAQLMKSYNGDVVFNEMN